MRSAIERAVGRAAGACWLLLVTAASVQAQITWHAPRMIGPESPAGLGLYWLQGSSLPGDGDAAFARLVIPGFDGAVSARGGVGEGVDGDLAGFGGIDLRAPIARHTDTQPLDLEWNGGIGVGVGNYVVASMPVAVSAGRSWTSESVWFAPYVSVGGVLDYRFGDEAPEEAYAIDSLVGVGLDLAFDSARRFVISVGATLGDRQSVAVGFVLGGGGRTRR